MADPRTTETVIRLIAIELDIPPAEVRKASSLRRDLKVDSVAAANLLFALEEEYAVDLDLERVDKLDTVDDIATLVERSIGSKADRVNDGSDEREQ
ncbi:MAG TPA: acyl carrier protein [Candidatus Binatia bacterium]|nr:acyl carrier protein [Candidatus Binatia bacterium]